MMPYPVVTDFHALMPNHPAQEENHLKVLRLLEKNPQITQRDLAHALGASLGKTNYCLKALLDKGLIKMQNFRSSQNKLAYSYLLTPSGIAEKTSLAKRFLKRKVAEYESLQREIETLRTEVALAGMQKKAVVKKPAPDDLSA